jgi:hypothetical protein
MRELHCALPLGINASAVSIQCQSQQVGFLEWSECQHVFGITRKLQFYWRAPVIIFRDVLP